MKIKSMKVKSNRKLIKPLLGIISLGGLSYYFELAFFIPVSTSDCCDEKEKEKEPPLNDEELERIEKFERYQWSEIQETICPNGVPNLALEPTLFKLARGELGLAHDPIFPQLEPNHKPSPIDFYDGIYEFTLFLDGYDLDDSFLYPSIWKCANNQIHSYLELVINRDDDGTLKDFASTFGHYNDTIAWRLNTEKKLADYFIKFEMDTREKPCVVTVVRDPIRRVLSGYNEVEYRLITGEEMSPNTMTMVRPPYIKVPEYSLNNTEAKAPQDDLENRFKTFVRNLAQEHPSIIRQNNVYRHIHPMSKILHPLKRFDLLPSDGNWVLPLNNEITETLPKFLAERCPRLKTIHRPRTHPSLRTNAEDDFPGFPPMPLDGQHESSADPFGVYEAAKSVLKKAGPAIRALCHIYAPDYACFYNGKGDSSLGVKEIPEICRDVYSSDLFRKSIIESVYRNTIIESDDDFVVINH